MNTWYPWGPWLINQRAKGIQPWLREKKQAHDVKFLKEHRSQGDGLTTTTINHHMVVVEGQRISTGGVVAVMVVLELMKRHRLDM